MKKNIIKHILFYSLTIFIFSTLSIVNISYHAITTLTEPMYNLLPEEHEFLIKNNIKYTDVKPYLKYKSFNVFEFFHYEHIRLKYNYSYLQTVNYIKYPNYYNEYVYPCAALFPSTPLILVNKSFYLTKDYIPQYLVNISLYNVKYIYRTSEEMMATKETLDNYFDLYQSACANNIDLVIYSAYRSYDKQFDLFYNVNNENDLFSARPGFSEHQAGYSLDISDTTHGLTQNLAKAKTYEWLKNNAYKYGFIIRYPQQKNSITKYNFEPWHYRYVGKYHAEKIYKENITLEEYLFCNFEL